MPRHQSAHYLHGRRGYLLIVDLDGSVHYLPLKTPLYARPKVVRTVAHWSYSGFEDSELLVSLADKTPNFLAGRTLSGNVKYCIHTSTTLLVGRIQGYGPNSYFGFICSRYDCGPTSRSARSLLSIIRVVLLPSLPIITTRLQWDGDFSNLSTSKLNSPTSINTR